MKHLQTRAFVLKTVDYGERDVIVTLLGRDTGRFSAIARSAKTSRKRFAGGLTTLRCLQANYTTRRNRDLATLNEINIIQDYAGIEGHLEKIAAASYATELVREMCREADEASATFDLLESFYDRVARLDFLPGLEVLLRHFELCLLELHGASPSLTHCARCGRSAREMDKLRLTRCGAGLVCSTCRHPGEAVGVIEPETLELLHYFRNLDGPTPTGLDLEPVYLQARRVVMHSIHQNLSHPLRSLAMLESLGLG
ncbi:MAG: DNA repair protein RecO [Bradymonadaceae bacterium]